MTVWYFDPKNLQAQPKNLHILYGHQSTVIDIFVEKVMGLIFSVDVDGLCLIHYLQTGQYVSCVKLKLSKADNEWVVKVKAHENGLIVFLTNKNRIMVYTVNGELIISKHIKTSIKDSSSNRKGFHFSKIMQFTFFENYGSKLLISTKTGQLALIDIFSLKKYKVFDLLKLKMKKNSRNEAMINFEVNQPLNTF